MFLLLRKSLIRNIFTRRQKNITIMSHNSLLFWISALRETPSPTEMLHCVTILHSVFYFAQGHFSPADVCCPEARAATFQLEDTLCYHFCSMLLSDTAHSIAQPPLCVANYLWAHADYSLALAFILLFSSEDKPLREGRLGWIQGQNPATKRRRKNPQPYLLFSNFSENFSF